MTCFYCSSSFLPLISIVFVYDDPRESVENKNTPVVFNLNVALNLIVVKMRFIPLVSLIAFISLVRHRNAQLSIDDYCACIEFNRTSCICGQREGETAGAVIIYCDGFRVSTHFPTLNNSKPATCYLPARQCDVAVVFENYLMPNILDNVFTDLFAGQQCIVRFAYRHNPQLEEISPNAFVADATAPLKELHIAHTGLTSIESIAVAMQRTHFDCNGATVVSLANNAIRDMLRPELTQSLSCVDSFSLNDNPRIFFALLALNGLHLSQLGLANTSIPEISAWHLSASKIKNLDLSRNPLLSIDHPHGLPTEGARIDNLKLSTSAATDRANVQNDPMAQIHLTCETVNASCKCVDVQTSRATKTLGQLLHDCDTGNACRSDCNDTSFAISEGVMASNRYKELIQRGYASYCDGNPADTVQWYQVFTNGSIDRITKENSKEYRCINSYMEPIGWLGVDMFR